MYVCRGGATSPPTGPPCHFGTAACQVVWQTTEEQSLILSNTAVCCHVHPYHFNPLLFMTPPMFMLMFMPS